MLILVNGSGGYANGGGEGHGVVMLKMLVIGGGGGDDGHSSGDYKLQAASLTNHLTNASKTKPFQNLFVTISSSFSIWFWWIKVIL